MSRIDRKTLIFRSRLASCHSNYTYILRISIFPGIVKKRPILSCKSPFFDPKLGLRQNPTKASDSTRQGASFGILMTVLPTPVEFSHGLQGFGMVCPCGPGWDVRLDLPKN